MVRGVVLDYVVIAVIAFLVLELLEPIAGASNVEPATEQEGRKTAVKVRIVTFYERNHLFLRQRDIGDLLPLPQRIVFDFLQQRVMQPGHCPGVFVVAVEVYGFLGHYILKLGNILLLIVQDVFPELVAFDDLDVGRKTYNEAASAFETVDSSLQ